MSYDNLIHKCEPCDKTFPSKGNLNRHYQSNIHKNKVVNNSLVKSESLIINNSLVKSESSIINNSLVKNEPSIINNSLVKIEPSIVKKFDCYCELCDITLSEKSKLKRHNGSERHRKKFELFQLMKNTTINNSLSLNIRENDEDKEEEDVLNLRCNICNCTCNSKLEIENHQDSNLYKSNLENYIESNLGNYIKNNLNENDINFLTLECNICGKSYRDKYVMELHLNTKLHKDNLIKSFLLSNSNEKILIEQPISKYKCEVCDVSFGDTNELKNHYTRKSHIEKAKDSNIVCGLQYKPRSNAVILLPKDIDGNYILRCEICDNSHADIFKLSNHYETDFHKRNVEKRDLLEAAKLKNDDDLFLIHLKNKKGKIIANTKVDKNTYINVIKYSICRNGGYASLTIGDNKYTLSRYIYYNLQNKISNPDMFIDHINSDRLDNRLENLREATSSQNARNKSKSINATSRYYGVYLDKNKWVCCLRHKGHYYTFRYDNESHAAYHHDLLIKELNLQDFSKLNNIEIPLGFKLKLAFKKFHDLPKGIYSYGNKFFISFSRKYFRGFNTVNEAQNFRFNKINEQIVIKHQKILNKPILRNDEGIAIINMFNRKKELVATTLVDDDIYYKLKMYNISYDGEYANICINGNKRRLSRFIINYAGNKYVDHADSNKLNNQKYNLRVLDTKGNNQNKSSAKNSTSKYVGVSYHKQNKKWLARIKVSKKITHLGYFFTEEKAVITRDKKAIELNKLDNYFKINLPVKDEPLLLSM